MKPVGETVDFQLTRYLVWILWCVISIAYRISQWSYASTIETLVLLVIVYDIGWHRWNAIREIKRDEEQEKRAIQREEAAEQRQIRRERQESLRKHWQELQSNLISLHRVASLLIQQRRFVTENSDSQDATTKFVLSMMRDRLPNVLEELGEVWGRTVAQLNVFPKPRDVLALEVQTVVEEVGKLLNSSTELKDETLGTLAKLSLRVADPGTLPDSR